MERDNDKRLIPMLLTSEEAILIKKCRENKTLWKAVWNFFKSMAGVDYY